MSQIAERFNCKAHSTISNIVFEIKKRLQKESKLKIKLNEIRENLKGQVSIEDFTPYIEGFR